MRVAYRFWMDAYEGKMDISDPHVCLHLILITLLYLFCLFIVIMPFYFARRIKRVEWQNSWQFKFIRYFTIAYFFGAGIVALFKFPSDLEADLTCLGLWFICIFIDWTCIATSFQFEKELNKVKKNYFFRKILYDKNRN